MRTIYTGGRVFTGDEPLQEAFIVADGRFTAIGTDADMLALAAPEDRIVPLQGRFVCPGFNDSHMHLLNFGNVLTQCALAEATSLAGMQDRLRTFAAEHALTGESWLLGRGWNQDRFTPATGIPTRGDLDAVSTEMPICIVRCCGHCLAVNSRALELLGIDESTPCPPGGAIDRDASGRLTGVFRDAAMTLVQARLPAPDRAALKNMLRTAMQALNAVGVTSCQTDDLCCFANIPWTEVLAAFRELEAEGGMTIRVYEQCQFTDIASLMDFLESGHRTGNGSPLFRIGPLKLLGDGSLGARTARLCGEYADAPGERGIAIFSQAELEAMITLAHISGMQIAVHAIGDGMLDMLIKAYRKAFARAPRKNHRSGIVHVQLTRPDQLRAMKRLSLHAYAQTVFLDYDSHIVHARAGEALAGTSYAFHTMQTLGLHVSNGTDCPVEAPDPMRGIQCAVTRQPLDGSLPPYRPEEAMTVAEALHSYTAEGAYASFEEGFKGRIAPGLAADFAILSGDPFAVPASGIARIHAVQTVLGGETVYVNGGV
ncbi:MAG: amidohydrolase [Clostridia bacterium]|nr:amidohydrolase [Clostridia bacterium]